MLEQVISYIERYQLLPARGEVVVGVSGGTDSLCLAHLLRSLCGPGRRFPDVELRAAHLNHLLRGSDSSRDASAVAALMQVWSIPVTLGEIDVLTLARTEKRSLEEAARLARYGFLREVARGGRIAVAHHADDQVETLLLHWLRGTGPGGSIGMSPRQGDIIRPLLGVTRAETVAYCQQHGITPMEDLSNRDPRFLRNRVRHELLPLLKELNPGIQQTLLRNAEVARVDLDWLESQVDTCWPRIVRASSETTIELHARAWQELPLSLQHHLLRRVTAQLCEGQSPLEARHFPLIANLLADHAGQQSVSLDLPRQLSLSYREGVLTFSRAPRVMLAAPETGVVSLPVPGRAQLPGTPWQVSADLLPDELAALVSSALRREDWSEVWRLLPVTPHVAYIDGTALTSPLLVRTRQPGDCIQPLGMQQEKRVKELLISRRIPHAARATLPLFFSDQHCLWLPGACLDQRVRLTSRTSRVVRLAIAM
jgi:tRNA(Ile)-lysidine synthase